MLGLKKYKSLFVGERLQNCKTKEGGLSNFFNFLKIGKSYSSDVLGLLVFILLGRIFRQFFMHIYQSDQKLWTFCHIYPDVFKIFSNFWWRQHCLISIVATFLFLLHMLYSVCLLSEKKRSASRVLLHDCIFFPNFHISKKFHIPAIFPMTSSKY